MTNIAGQTRLEVSGLAGLIGEIYLDLQCSKSWDLVSEVHSCFPPPAGSFWMITLQDEMVSDKISSIEQASIVTCIACKPTQSQQDQVVTELSALLGVGCKVDDLMYQSHLIWQSLTSVSFSDGFNHSLDNVPLPSGLRRLSFGSNFNKRLDNTVLPEGLQEIKFGRDFNQPLDNVTFPSSLQTLTFGRDFNQSMDKVVLPKGLETLTFGREFNLHRIDYMDLPCGLQILLCGRCAERVF